MAERRTQAPVALSVTEQSPVNEQATTNPGHIDQSGFSKTPLTEELVEKRELDQNLPNTIEEFKAKIEEHPVAFHEGTITAEKPASKRWTVKRGIAAAAIGIATAGGIFGAQKLFGNEYIEGEDGMLYSPDVVATAPILANEAPASSEKIDTAEQPLDPATTDPEVFAAQSYEAILSETVPLLEERREDSLNKIDEHFASLGQETIPKRDQVVPISEELMFAQDIERNIAADTFTITDIARTQPTLAENLTAALYTDQALRDSLIKDGFNGYSHASRSTVYALSPELDRGSYAGYTVEGPTFITLTGNLDPMMSGDSSEIPLFNRILEKHTYDGDKVHYSVGYHIQESNNNFIEYPENLAPAAK